MPHTAGHRVATRALALFAGLGLASCAVIAATPASAAPVASVATTSGTTSAASTAHDPTGALKSVKIVGGMLQLGGWAFDPDARAGNVYVVAKLDGVSDIAGGWTSVTDAPIAAKYATGSTPGYLLTMPLPSGKHTVCMLIRNLGAGTASTHGCTSLPLGRVLSTAQVAAHKPTGKITAATATPSAVRYHGYVTDPDWRNSQLRVVLYVDNAPAATVLSAGRVTPAVPGTGKNSAFDVTVPVSKGTHVGCVWAVNIGLGGSNTFLGCDPVDTRGTAGTAPVVQPALNKTVMADALAHKGQPYVWGATGPKSFDCSGLVLYSYTKAVAAMNTKLPASQRIALSLPRVSEDQAKVARLIPASRAVPGDLVFMFDSEGDVYHVGLYASPGKLFAAIDYGYGVNYQTIWDPSSVMYGSLTHT